MRISRLWKLGVLSVLLQAAAGDALAEAPETCWRFMSLDKSNPVHLIALPDSKPKLRFVASAEITLLPDEGEEGYPADAVVQLPSDGGRVVVHEGPLDVEQDKVTYRIPQGKTGLSPPTFIAEKGMEVKLLKLPKDGKLAAGDEAIVQLSGAPQRVGMDGSLVLRPAPRPTSGLELLLPNLAWTRGGRSIDIEMIAPRFNQTELNGADLQACFFASVDGSVQGVEAPVDVLATEDGLARLRVYLPERVNDFADGLTSSVELQILGPGLDTMSNQVRLRINNPFGAFSLAIVVTGVLLFVIRHFVPAATVGRSKHKLIRFVQGTDGKPSLARFQMLSWTVLVMIGFFYVFFASGDLFNVSQQVLILLGMAGAGAVGARWVDSGEPPKTVEGASWFWQMLSVNGSADLLRLQLFLFTAAIWVYVAARLLYDQQFPELDENVLLLMGITNAVYVGGKYADSSGRAQGVGKLCTQLTTKADEVERKRVEIDTLKKEIADLTESGTNKPIAGKEDEHKEKKELLTAAEGVGKKLENEFRALAKKVNEQAIGVTS